MRSKFLKWTALTAAAVIAGGMLAGCGQAPTNAGTEGQESAQSTSGNLIMGTNAAFQPFEYIAADGLVGEYDGIDVAIALKIAEKAGKELQIEDMEFDGLIASVSTGKVDMAVAGMTVTEERKESVDFSDPYYTATQVMLVQSDNTSIAKAEDLHDKKVGVVLGYTGDTLVSEIVDNDSQITRANRGIDVVQDVKNGKLDAVVIDYATGKALAEKTGLKVVEDKEAFETEEYAIAVKKGNTELLEVINETLGEMKESGEIEKLAEEYDKKLSAE